MGESAFLNREVMAPGRVIEQCGLTQDVLFDKSNGKPAEKKSMAQLDVQYLLERNCLHGGNHPFGVTVL